MKQRITPDQLRELTPSQQEKLREWWKPQEGDWVFNGNKEALLHTDADTDWIMFGSYTEVSKANSIKEAEPEIKSKCLPLLNIGQCIELLKTIQAKQDVGTYISIECGHDEDWFLGHEERTTDKVEYIQYEDHELIDVLFEAIKSIL
jgi:hypothetical protein